MRTPLLHRFSVLPFIVASACGNGGSEDATKQAEGVGVSGTPALEEQPAVPFAADAEKEQALLQEIERLREQVATLEGERDSYQQRIRELESQAARSCRFRPASRGKASRRAS